MNLSWQMNWEKLLQIIKIEKKRHNVAIEGKFYWAKKQTNNNNNNNSANNKKYERKPTEKTQGNKKRLF